MWLSPYCQHAENQRTEVQLEEMNSSLWTTHTGWGDHKGLATVGPRLWGIVGIGSHQIEAFSRVSSCQWNCIHPYRARGEKGATCGFYSFWHSLLLYQDVVNLRKLDIHEVPGGAEIHHCWLVNLSLAQATKIKHYLKVTGPMSCRGC